jgi:UDP-N-acetylmuramoyl-L-alanyl-D-glutamate--2,6-diaminopimelate ligase
MKLKKLIQGFPLEVKGSKEIENSGLCTDSRRTAPGNLFIAKKGDSFDGNEYIAQAIDCGASAILTQFYNPFVKVPQLIHPDPQNLEAQLATRYYSSPSSELFVVGVTGTNGKTTTTYLVRHLLNALKKPSGLIGTIETILGRRRSFSSLTTHDVISNHKLLREMLEEGCQAAVLEVSSHGLDQGRVGEVQFDAVIFTNLTPDHLDYHADEKAYALAKKQLFQLLDQSSKPSKLAIANADDPWHLFLLDCCLSPQLLYGLGEKADLRAEAIELSPGGSRFTASYKGEKQTFKTSLIGRFNIYNLLGAIAVGLHCGHTLKEMAPIFSKVQSAPGRLERVENSTGKHVFVDYAHTSDALQNVLETLRETAKGKIITVFGAGGNRDPGRRPGLAKAAESLSDLCIITSDNPRQEDPQEICRQILAAFKAPDTVRVEIDRKRAIELAIGQAQPNDIVLIAGKGHERMQIFSHQTVPFDDREVALSFLTEAP